MTQEDAEQDECTDDYPRQRLPGASTFLHVSILPHRSPRFYCRPPKCGHQLSSSKRRLVSRDHRHRHGHGLRQARKQHGKSELLDDIVAAKPERDHTHYRSPDELRQHELEHLRDSVSLRETKATPEEVEEYRRFIVTLSDQVAAAHREHGQDVSASEQAAINDITEALNATAE